MIPTEYKKDTFEALELFLLRMRVFLEKLLNAKNSKDWEKKFIDILSSFDDKTKLGNWNKTINRKDNKNKNLIDLVDFPDLKIISINFKDEFKPYFEENTNSLPTWFNEITIVRNELFHVNTTLKVEDINLAWIYMERIAIYIKDAELEYKLKAIKNSRGKINNKLKFDNLNNDNAKFLINKSNISTNQIKESTISKRNKINKNTQLTNILPFNISKKIFKILILPFRDSDDYNKITNLGQAFTDTISKKYDLEKLGIEINYNSAFYYHITFDKARELGNIFKVDLVIWGKDSKSILNSVNILHLNSLNIFHFHYVLINSKNENEEILNIKEFGEFKAKKLIKIISGELYLKSENIMYWVLCNKYYQEKDYKTALNIVFKIDRKYFLNQDINYFIALCYFFMNKYRETIIFLEKALEIEKKEKKEKNPNCYIMLLAVAIMQEYHFKSHKKSKSMYEIAINNYNESAEANLLYAIYILKHDNDIEKAKSFYTQAKNLKIKEKILELE